MKTKFLLFAFLLTIVTGAFAQTERQHLVVWLKNGEKVYYQLTEEPKTTFTNGKLMITSSTVNVTYDLPKVIRYTYEGAITHIGSSTTGKMGFRQNDDGIILDFIPAGKKVSVYNLAGVLLQTLYTDGSPAFQISLKNYPFGVYIINIGEHSIKITKR